MRMQKKEKTGGGRGSEAEWKSESCALRLIEAAFVVC